MSKKYIPTAPQMALLKECIKRGGCIYQRGHSLSTVRACEARLWVVFRGREYSGDDNTIKITDMGRGVVSLHE